MNNNKLIPFDIPEELTKYDTSKYHIVSVAYSETVTYLKGADSAPEAIINASAQVELYDIDTESEPYLNGISHSEINVDTNIQKLLVDIEKTTSSCLKNNKFQIMLGGEHSISFGAIKACKNHFEDLCVLQIDAHSDLRTEYLGSPFNHACAMIHVFNNNIPLIQVGIRNSSKEEHILIKENPSKITTFFANSSGLDVESVIKSIKNKNVYLTIDLDGFDTSVIPHVGTPEPGGLTWYEVIRLLEKVFKNFNVVASDIVELAPNEYSAQSDFTAAKLLYKLLCLKQFSIKQIRG